MDAIGALSWTFVSESPVPDDAAELLVPGEQAVAAYRTVRDAAIFTDRRLIVRDAQGMTGRKVEIYSLPYSSIHMWSSENARTLDFSAEIELWTRAGTIKISVRKGIDVRRLDHLIARSVLS
ncbi:PH domain-containing protein [Ornithinimicrobium sediminis]|uniref:PH domain-containing protein n=1 Tax=Ornithinimicrobium sediminis TaxID=2904603 RepID=UPI001E3E1C94|nr:PH domain-containing protein [Ornithinimicrobium sediminis]MCE0485264.1 PH domain-containing protein [Ornithinimicrobium sediminis]